MQPTDKTTKNSLDHPPDYPLLLAEVKERIRSAQYEALKAVNKELVGLYWDIGRLIVERQDAQGWGKAVVERLSADLRQEFPGVGGFSVQNLWYMRQFYSEYQGNEKLQSLVGEIAWTHNLAIMSKCKDPLEREFYIRMTRKFGWSKNVLIHQIDNQSYEKIPAGPDQLRPGADAGVARPGQAGGARTNTPSTFWSWARNTASGNWNGRSLPGSRISCGPWAACSPSWAASTGWRWTAESSSSTLLLFHRRLRCLVAIELKIGEFMPEFVGKMQFYLAALDRQVRQEDENPSIGIILCKEKSRTIVEYALHDARKPIGVATYEITRTLPKALQGHLPSPADIALLLEDL